MYQMHIFRLKLVENRIQRGEQGGDERRKQIEQNKETSQWLYILMSKTGIRIRIGIGMIDFTYLSDHSTKSQYNGILYRFSDIITEFVPFGAHKTKTEK